MGALCGEMFKRESDRNSAHGPFITNFSPMLRYVGCCMGCMLSNPLFFFVFGLILTHDTPVSGGVSKPQVTGPLPPPLRGASAIFIYTMEPSLPFRLLLRRVGMS